MKIDKISILGLGYIGLPLAIVLADKSIHINGFDTNQKVLDDLQKLKIKIKEKDLIKKFKNTKVQKYLRVSNKLIKSDVYIVAVPTPFNKKKNKPDISLVKKAINKIVHLLVSGNLVIIESTCPVGTTELVKKLIYKKRPDLKKDSINISYCPERILPGNTLKELINNNRIIGGINTNSSKYASKIYKIFVEGNIHITDSKTAEMSKLAENTYRDINIAYANELSMIAKKNGINVWELIKLTNLHPRVNILNPGPGVGGHCIAVDPWFLVSQNQKLTKIILSAREVNDNKIKWVIQEIKKRIKILSIKNNLFTLGFFGITYKPDSNDLRESSSLKIVKHFLKNKKLKVIICEPNLNENELKFAKVEKLNVIKTLKKADLSIVLVNHSQFKKSNFKSLPEDKFIDISGLLSKR